MLVFTQAVAFVILNQLCEWVSYVVKQNKHCEGHKTDFSPYMVCSYKIIIMKSVLCYNFVSLCSYGSQKQLYY